MSGDITSADVLGQGSCHLLSEVGWKLQHLRSLSFGRLPIVCGVMRNCRYLDWNDPADDRSARVPRNESVCEVLCRRVHSTRRLFSSGVTVIDSTYRPRRIASGRAFNLNRGGAGNYPYKVNGLRGHLSGEDPDTRQGRLGSKPKPITGPCDIGDSIKGIVRNGNGDANVMHQRLNESAAHVPDQGCPLRSTLPQSRQTPLTPSSTRPGQAEPYVTYGAWLTLWATGKRFFSLEYEKESVISGHMFFVIPLALSILLRGNPDSR